MAERREHELAPLLREANDLLRRILRALLNEAQDNVSGGAIARIGDTMVPIQPGNTPVFQVTPTFSGAPFATLAAQASVTSSDTTNFPVALVPTDTTGLTFEAVIPEGAVIPTGGEAVSVSWVYTNTDGTVATVTATLTEQGLTDDVTGGTVVQIA